MPIPNVAADITDVDTVARAPVGTVISIQGGPSEPGEKRFVYVFNTGAALAQGALALRKSAGAVDQAFTVSPIAGSATAAYGARAVGFAQVAVAAERYCWLQCYGVGYVLPGGNVSADTGIIATSGAAAGSVTAAGGVTGRTVGHAMAALSSTVLAKAFIDIN